MNESELTAAGFVRDWRVAGNFYRRGNGGPYSSPDTDLAGVRVHPDGSTERFRWVKPRAFSEHGERFLGHWERVYTEIATS